MLALIVCVMALFTGAAQAAEYTVDYKNSGVAFAGTHAGKPFKGTFGEWTAQVDFDPAMLETSTISATFKLESATTGDKMYDGTLPSADWFDVKNHPSAMFVSKAIKDNEDGTYSTRGDLTIRGITHLVDFNFTLSDVSTSPVKMKSNFVINRLDYDIGKKSDGSAEWVGKEINVTLDMKATLK